MAFKCRTLKVNDVTTTIVASGAKLFVIIAWIIIHFGRNPRKGGSPPKDSNAGNTMNLINVVSLFCYYGLVNEGCFG
jgi:hypothetical protein